nr:MAG TPA: hypothetical protein [Herelleviridae sp.]
MSGRTVLRQCRRRGTALAHPCRELRKGFVGCGHLRRRAGQLSHRG